MRIKDLKIPFFFAFGKIVFHFLTNTNWGFHRDELLYLALGRHPDWGFWSNPPLTGWLSWLGQNTLGDGQGAIRLIPALFSAATIFLCILMANKMGGKKRAQILAGVAAVSSLAYLRSGTMFQPVATDIFFWTLSTYLLVCYLRSKKDTYLFLLGASIGFGFLNKYTVLFLVLAILIGLVFTSARKVFLKKEIYLAGGISLLIVLPNIWWQWEHSFPVVAHLTELAEDQLSNVNPIHFLFGQLRMHLWSFLVWLPGLYFLLANKEMEKFRPLAWLAIATILLFLLLSGKVYYTLGIFPVLMAAGGIFWEKQIKSTRKYWGLIGFILIANLSMLPASVPILSVEKSVVYFERLGIEALLRWERGNIESLPQDYADMLGWEELATISDAAVKRAGNPEQCLIYCENYGQAGAVQYFGNHPERVVSFSDTYRLWMPEKIPPNVKHLIYINDELGEDIKNLFEKIETIGEITTAHARERGTKVYLCQEARSPFHLFWGKRVSEVKKQYHL